METYINLDAFTPKSLTVRINGAEYPVKDITMEHFLELLELSRGAIGADETLDQSIREIKKAALISPWIRFKKWFCRVIRFGRPISEYEGTCKLYKFLHKIMPEVPGELILNMTQTQISSLLEFLIRVCYEGKNDPDFRKPMLG
jgi:hypothetical protein